MISTRPLTSADIPVMDPILMAAYGNPTSFQPRLSRFLGLGPGNWVLAEVDGRPAGMGGINVLGETAYVAMVVTDPPLQGRGVGTAVMRRVLELAGERGCGTVLLDASPAGRPLYEKLGFVADDSVGHWKRPAQGKVPRGSQDDAAAGIRTLASPEVDSRSFLGAIRDLDRAAYGADRAAFLASYAADDPGLVAMLGDRVEASSARAYLIVQADTGNLGPWVAQDAEAGRALAGWALGLGIADRELSVYVPGGNTECRRLIADSGFSEHRVLTHMRLGPDLRADRRRLVWGQANLALG